ncbi:restriction endonuclease subunit S, partial [Ureaplasma zalophigenitalium]
FTNDWEQRRIEDLVNLVKKSSLLITQIKNKGSYPVYSAGTFFGYNDLYFTNEPSILISVDGSIGNLMYLDVNSWFISTNNALFASNIVSTWFLYYLLKTVKFNTYWTGSTIPHLYFKTYKKIKKLIPSKNEQNCIVKIMHSLNTSISLL